MNRRIFTITLVIFVLVVLGVAVGLWLGQLMASDASPYSAVYLATGDIYFGKLSWFPTPKLENVWFVQRSVDQSNQVRSGLARFTGAFWGPVDRVYLNSRQIVFWTRISSTSDVAKVFSDPALLEKLRNSNILPEVVPNNSPPAKK